MGSQGIYQKFRATKMAVHYDSAIILRFFFGSLASDWECTATSTKYRIGSIGTEKEVSASAADGYYL